MFPRAPIAARRCLPRAAGICAIYAVLAMLAAPAALAQSITLLHTPPETLPPGEPFVVRGQVFGVATLDRLVLSYRLNGAEWIRLEMRPENNDTYSATIPAASLEEGTLLTYFVYATDFNGETKLAFRSGPAPARVFVRKVEQPKPPAPIPVPAQEEKVAPADSHAEVPLAEKPAPVPVKVEPPAPEQHVSVARGHEQPLTDASGAITVYTAAQMRALGVRTLADLLKFAPGFETARDVQGFWRVSSRGRSSDAEIAVVMDGQRLNNPYDGRVNWAMSIENLARVEILRSTSTVLAGPGAFAVVNLVPNRDSGAGIEGAAGSFGQSGGHWQNAYDGHLRVSGKLGSVRLSVDADATREDGYVATIPTDARTAAATAAGTTPPGPSQTDDHGLTFGGGLRIEYESEGGARVFFGGRAWNQERGALLGFSDVVGPGSDLSWMSFSGVAGFSVPFGGWALSVRATGNDQLTDRMFVVLPPGASAGGATFDTGARLDTQAVVWTAGLDVELTHALEKTNFFTLGFTGQRQALTTFALSSNVVDTSPTSHDAFVPKPPEKPIDAFGVRQFGGAYVRDEWRIAKRLRLLLAVRGDIVTGFGATRIEPSPQAGLVFLPAPEVAARFLFSRSFRMPTYQEFLSYAPLLSSVVRGQVAAPDPSTAPLQPVQVTSLEAMLDGSHWAGWGRASGRVSAYWNQYSNPIAAQGAAGMLALENRTGVRVVGVEIEGRHEWPRRHALAFINASWFRSQDMDAVNAGEAEFSYLTNVPQLRANAGAVIPINDLLLVGLTGSFSSERRNNTRTPLEAAVPYRMPAYLLLGATLETAPILKHLSLAASVYNLANLPFSDLVPYPKAVPYQLPREGIHGLVSLRLGY